MGFIRPHIRPKHEAIMTRCVLFIILTSSLLSSCLDLPCPDDPNYPTHSIVLEFRDSMTNEAIPLDSLRYTMFHHLELGHRQPIPIDTVWNCSWSEVFGLGLEFDQVTMILPLHLMDTISTFVISGPNISDTIETVYHPELVFYGERHRCGYQLYVEELRIIRSTLAVEYVIHDKCTHHFKVVVNL